MILDVIRLRRGVAVSAAIAVLAAMPLAHAAEDADADAPTKSGSSQAAPAAAKETPAEKKVTALEEVIVTARGYAEDVKDVPISITAFDSKTIEAAGIRNLQDVANLTPGLTFFNPFGENLPTPVIRGIAPTDIFGTNNAAFFLDGIYVSGREGLNFNQLEIDRIEVVKGPQSARYGRNAFSGAVNFITRMPGEEFGGKVKTSLGNEGKFVGQFTLDSGALGTEMLHASISGIFDQYNGTYNNPIASDNSIGGHTFRSYVGTLNFTPTDDLTATLRYYYSDDEIDETPTAALPANCENRINDGTPDQIRLQNYCGKVPYLKYLPGLNGSSDAIPKVAQATGEHRDLDRSSLNVNWDLHEYGTITSLTGWSYTEQHSKSDFNHSLGELQPFLYALPCTQENPGTPNFCPPTSPATNIFFTGVYDIEGGGKTTEWSEELRFTSPREERFRYSAGAIYYRTVGKAYPGGGLVATQPQPDSVTNPTFEQPGLPPFCVPSASCGPTDLQPPNFAIGTAIFYSFFTPDGGLDPLGRIQSKGVVDGYGVFSGVEYDITDRLKANAELRFSEEKQENYYYNYVGCPDFSPSTIAACGDDFYDLRVTSIESTDRSSTRFNSWTGRVGLDFQVNDDWMLYTSVANSTKPGGVGLVGVTDVNGDDYTFENPFDQEKITAYELGAKGITADGKLGLDVSLFFNDWSKIVLPQLVEQLDGIVFEQPERFLENVGDAHVWGWEMTADVAMAEDLTSRFTVAWTDSTWVNGSQAQYAQFPTFAPDGDFSGNKMLRQPEWTASASFGYTHELRGNWEWFARADTNYQSKYYVGNDNESYVPSHIYVNASLGTKNDRFNMQLWARNLFNDLHASAAFRDVYLANTSGLYPTDASGTTVSTPYGNYETFGSRPNFDQFVPWRYTVSYPEQRTYGVSFEYKFGGMAE